MTEKENEFIDSFKSLMVRYNVRIIRSKDEYHNAIYTLTNDSEQRFGEIYLDIIDDLVKEIGYTDFYNEEDKK